MAEISKMGFKKCILPEANLKRMNDNKGISITGVKTVSEAIEILLDCLLVMDCFGITKDLEEDLILLLER